MHKKSNRIQQDITFFLLVHIYMKLNMFRATRRPSSGAKTALAASVFSYVNGWWTCACWTLYEKPEVAIAVLGS
jgi:hypothetical protein